MEFVDPLYSSQRRYDTAIIVWSNFINGARSRKWYFVTWQMKYSHL